MRLESAQQLKQQLLRDILVPLIVRASKLRSGAATAGFRATGSMAGEVTPFGVGARPGDTLPQVQRSIALGVAPHSKGYRLAIRLQRPSLRNSSLVEHVTRRARGEVDMRFVGRIDKRVKKPAALPWYRRNARPLVIGASVGHVKVTAGTLGCFVKRASAVYLLSNNHVLANEDRAK